MVVGPYDPDAIRRLKEHGDLYMSGSGRSCGPCSPTGWSTSCTCSCTRRRAGAGPRLFDESLPPATWHRADAALYDNGVTYLKLTPAS